MSHAAVDTDPHAHGHADDHHDEHADAELAKSDREIRRTLFAVTCVSLIVSTLIATILFASLRYNLVCDAAIAAAHADRRIAEQVGRWQAGWFIRGNLKTTSDGGHADLRIPVKGMIDTGVLHVIATRSDGSWQIDSLTFTPSTGTEPLLVPITELAPPPTSPVMTPAR